MPEDARDRPSTTSSTTAATASRPTPPSTSRSAGPTRTSNPRCGRGARPAPARCRRRLRSPSRCSRTGATTATATPCSSTRPAVGGRDSGAAARTTADGRIRFTAPTGPAADQLLSVEFAVTDGRSAPVKKSIELPGPGARSPEPSRRSAEPDVVRGEVGKPIKIRPLLNDLPGSDPDTTDAELVARREGPPAARRQGRHRPRAGQLLHRRRAGHLLPQLRRRLRHRRRSTRARSAST